MLLKYLSFVFICKYLLTAGLRVGLCTLCFCFSTKMLRLNAPILPLKCSVSPKKSLKCSDNAHYTNDFLINFNIFDMVLTVASYKNVHVLQVTTTYKKNLRPLTCPQSPRVAFAVFVCEF